MAAPKFENQECFCAYIAMLGPFKDQLLTLLQTIRLLIEPVQAAYLLTNYSLEDEARKLVLNTALEVMDQAVGVVEAPLKILESKSKAWADCPPVANLSTIFRKTREFVLKDVYETRWQIKQLEHETNKTNNTNGEIDRLLVLLDEFTSAIENC